ncbi:unnamed protein product [Adineta steineri]|uniref:Uncharacterized protein n=1 Tax=Adineta steineri TaxID=433720 RepID=A0A814CSW0_9BILA|nr:unnamed protein product [Adineta steineri]CAF3794171.1 unnamed protein product [Adineta steineri]
MFEDLPDDILIIIFQYSGDPYTILTTYLGLNQRINRILIDKHLHLLTNFLYTKYISDYYDSEIFQNASKQLLMVNSNIDKTKLDEIFRPLIPFHIRQTYIQQGQEFQLLTEQHNSIRQNLSNDEKRQVDCEVKVQFLNLNKLDQSIETFQNIKKLILKQGARCECEDGPGRFNLIIAVKYLLLVHISEPNFTSPISPHLLTQTFKALLVSNTNLLYNQDYVGYTGDPMDIWKLIDIIVFTISSLKCHFRDRNSSTLVNMKYYHEIVYFYLFIIQCQKQTHREQEKNMFLMLDYISNMNDNLLIQLTNTELLKMVVEETNFNDTEDNYWLETHLRQKVEYVVKTKQFHVIVYLAQSERIPWKKTFNEPKNFIRKFINAIILDPSGQRFLLQTMGTISLDLFFFKKQVFFLLLKKRERKLLEQLLQSSPEFINELDEDENDALLYTCLKISGLRHRIIELLIKMGSNMERRNSQGLNFMDTLELPRNRSLSKKLVEFEIIFNDK